MTGVLRRVPAAGQAGPGEVAARFRSLLPSLLPAERSVAKVLLDALDEVGDLSSQQIAELAGTSRATVVRTCQSAGFTGYQQVRVLLARDAALAQAADPGRAVSGLAAVTFDHFAKVAAAMEAMTVLLDPEHVERAVRALAQADRVQVTGHGLSEPVALDLVARLVRLGVSVAHHADAISEMVVARRLGAGEVLVAVSGSGSHSDTLAVCRSAHESGATVIVLTAFARSPIAQLADVVLLVGMPGGAELTDTTRIPQAILVEGLVAGLTRALGSRAATAEATTLEVVSGFVSD